MAININNLNSQLSGILKNSNLDAILEKKSQIVGATSCKLETSLTKVGEAVSGILPLSGGDNLLDNVSALDSIVEITGQVPGLSNELIGDISSTTSNISSAIGETVANGELDLIISSGAPEAISRSLTNVTGKTAEDISSVLKSVATLDGQEGISKITASISGGLGISTGIADVTKTFEGSFKDLMGSVGGGLLSNLIRKADKSFDLITKGLLIGTDIDIDIIASLIEKGDKAKAIALISAQSTIPFGEIEQTVNKLDLSPSANISNGASPVVGLVSFLTLTLPKS